MVRDEPLSAPDPDAVREASERTIGRRVEAVAPIEPGLNAVYRVEFADGTRTVCKVAILSEPTELLAEPVLLRWIDRVTAVPVPDVIDVAPRGAGSLSVPHYHQAYREGRTDATVLELTADERDSLIHESGRHLAALHDLDLVHSSWPGADVAFGRIRGRDGELYADPGHDTWSERFAAIVDDTVAGLRGEGYTVDETAPGADLAGPVRGALGGPPAPVAGWDGEPALVVGDYRPANLVLAPRDETPPIVEAVLDVGGCSVGDGLFDLARAEGALVDVPLGGTTAADRLRTRLRDAYADERDVSPSFGDRYEAYRALSAARRIASLGYWAQFAHESDPDAVADRLRSFVSDRLAAIG